MHQEATVCHLLRGDGPKTETLLGERKSRFCNGVLNGPGGKFNPDETALQCLCREVEEEIGVVVDPISAKHYASADFYHPVAEGYYAHKWRVHYFTATRWRGEPRPLAGFVNLQWFFIGKLPFDRMMSDQRLWLPAALPLRENGQLMELEIFYGDGGLRTVGRWVFRLVEKSKFVKSGVT
ncbi:NUDIX domain-containing protein [Candidatus Nomurabacteria bacterium]|nr:NUDIX domain-containing protein [Candidatus Nomurabacteria bacterium]